MQWDITFQKPLNSDVSNFHAAALGAHEQVLKSRGIFFNARRQG